MQRFTRWLLRWHGLPVVALLVFISLPVVLFARASSDSGGGASIPQLVVVGLLGVAVLVLVIRLPAMLAGVDPDAAVIAAGLTAAPDQQRLLTRWLQRTRWARNVGGVAGLVWWVFGTSLQGDVLLYGVGGVAIGSVAAQLHHVTRPSGTRTARLDRRTVADYLPPGWRRRMIATAALAAALAVAGLVLDDSGSAAPWGGAALVALGACHVVQRRVAGRPRPALATGLALADDLARQLAIDRGLAQPATYFALALIAHGASELEPSLGGWATLISVGAWLYALSAWWRNRRLGLDAVLDRPLPAPAPV